MLQNETTQIIYPRLAVIADDITGSFDTGVQFQKRGAAVQVALSTQLPGTLAGVDVLVIDAETRHASPEETYAQIRRLAEWTVRMGIPHLYVKTDSGLRGHVGMALKAALDAVGCELCAFAPAYPEMDRVTRNGQQIISGVPLSSSVFGQDLFDPVQASSIRDMVRSSGAAVLELPLDKPYDTIVDAPCVAVFDVEENADFDCIADHLAEMGQLRLTAGCAAFASRLPRVLDLPDDLQDAPEVTPPLLVVCGSLNPITKEQMEYGEAQGNSRSTLCMAQLLNPDYFVSEEGCAWLAQLQMQMQERRTILLDTKGETSCETDASLSVDEARVRISHQLGAMMHQLIAMDEQEAYTPMIIGGDTLMSFLEQVSSLDVMLEGEVVPGVVCFSVTAAGKRVRMLSKSGGFGRVTLLRDIVATQAL